jgi:Zn-dependent alcohol dehydrogenase
VELDPPRRGEVSIEVVPAGACRSDLHFQNGVVLTHGERTITGPYRGSAHPRQDMPRIADWCARETDAVGRGVLIFSRGGVPCQ